MTSGSSVSDNLMKRYGLYWLRAITLGAGLNFVLTGYLMGNQKWKFQHAAPLSAFICVNLSYAADRLIFGNKKEPEDLEPDTIIVSTPHSCPICSEYPCICDSWDSGTIPLDKPL